MSINSEQRAALSEGFVNRFGGNVSEAQSLKDLQSLPELEKLLAFYGGNVFLKSANKYINQEGLVYKGELSSKLAFDIQTKDGKYTLSVGYHEGDAEHWKFVNYGVRGTKAGTSQRDFSFKNNKPSRKMTDAIEKWMVERGIQVRNVKRSISDYETKREGLENPQRQQAYLLAKIIKMYGIKPRNYMEKAAAETFNATFAQQVTQAVGKDLKIFIKSWQ